MAVLLLGATEIVLSDNTVSDRPDHERHVAGRVGQMVFTRVPFLNFSRCTNAWFQASRKKSFRPRFQL